MTYIRREGKNKVRSQGMKEERKKGKDGWKNELKGGMEEDRRDRMM